MTKKKKNAVALVMLLIATGLYGCTQTGRPPRKLMPERDTTTLLEKNLSSDYLLGTPANGLPVFATTPVDLTFNGATEGFLSVSLPDAAKDSATVNLVNAFKPFASSLLSNWAKQERHGVLLDLSTHDKETFRTDYLLRNEGDFTIPVVIIWDKESAYRAATLKKLVQDVPSVTLDKISGDNPLNNTTIEN